MTASRHPWFQSTIPVDPPLPGGGWGGGLPGAQGGAILGLISSLIGAVQQLVSSLFGGQAPGAGQAPGSPWNGQGHAFFHDADLSSTGDPHLALVGTRHGPGGDGHVNDRFDSMTSHRDLFDSDDIAGRLPRLDRGEQSRCERRHDEPFGDGPRRISGATRSP